MPTSPETLSRQQATRSTVIPWPIDIKPQHDAADTIPTGPWTYAEGTTTRIPLAERYPEAAHASTDVGQEDKPPMTDTDRRWVITLYTVSAALVALAAWLSFLR